MNYKLGNFEVVKSSKGYEIIRHDRIGCATYPVMDIRNMWFHIQPFESFIHAVSFLKSNHNNLI